MFTGLVESTARVLSLQHLGEQARLKLEIAFAKELTLGESIAVNGCCLTVAEFDDQSVTFDILSQTLKLTSLGQLKEESLVNLERALKASDRMGGHFVQGHVDGTGIIKELSSRGQDHKLEILIPEEQLRFCINQGSIAIDGISLTIAELTTDSCVFWITPHTHAHTNLQNLSEGGIVNIETDLLAKYVAKLTKS